MSAWVKVMNSLRSHPKTLALSDAAFRLYVSSLLYANEQLTDGRLEHHVLNAIAPTLKRPRVAKDELLNAELWENGDGCWHIHDYLAVQSSSGEIGEKRAATADRVAKHRAGNADVTRYMPDPVTPPRVRAKEEEEEEEERTTPPKPPASGGRDRDWVRFAKRMQAWAVAHPPTAEEAKRFASLAAAVPRDRWAPHLHAHGSPTGVLLIGTGALATATNPDAVGWYHDRYGRLADEHVGAHDFVACGCAGVWR